VLHHNAIDLATHLEIGGVTDLVPGHQNRTDRSRSVKGLACRYCVVLACQSRMDTSLTIVYPAIASRACSRFARRSDDR